MMIKAYKGFESDMTCRGFQYEDGKEYRLKRNERPSLCCKGFHACLDPIDVFNYYPYEKEVPVFGTDSLGLHMETILFKTEYRIVYLHGIIVFGNPLETDDTKVCASKITIGPPITVEEMKKLHEQLIYEYKYILRTHLASPFHTYSYHKWIQTMSQIK